MFGASYVPGTSALTALALGASDAPSLGLTDSALRLGLDGQAILHGHLYLIK